MKQKSIEHIIEDAGIIISEPGEIPSEMPEEVIEVSVPDSADPHAEDRKLFRQVCQETFVQKFERELAEEEP